MPHTDDAVFMRLALDKAREGVAQGQQPFGACLVQEGNVLACLVNRVLATGDLTAHPETQAVREACQHLRSTDLSGCVMYATCEPCAMCFTVAHFANVSRLVFGARLEDARRFGFGRFPVPTTVLKELAQSPVEVVGDFLRAESLALMQHWAEQQRGAAGGR